MSDTPTSLGELFRSLGLTLSVRAADDEDDGWACTLTRPDGQTYEIESVTFFDVDPETGDEWMAEPSPSRVLSVLAGGEIEDEDGNTAGDLAEEAARTFLGEDAYEQLLELVAIGIE